VGEQSNAYRILLRYDRKSRHRRIKKQRRYERLAATSQFGNTPSRPTQDPTSPRPFHRAPRVLHRTSIRRRFEVTFPPTLSGASRRGLDCTLSTRTILAPTPYQSLRRLAITRNYPPSTRAAGALALGSVAGRQPDRLMVGSAEGAHSPADCLYRRSDHLGDGRV
jgi:hypothetical protein